MVHEKQGHTPGPWVIQQQTPDGPMSIMADRYTSIQQGYPFLAEIVYYDVDKVEATANAHLIAVAPELLAFVKQLFRYADSGNHPGLTGFLMPGSTETTFTANGRDIINKAEGGA